ncbi:MAG: hypothetical protein IRZ32_06715 [Solirubrobacteraceae bacterium]|nr:hypothetical protein [Solirubrobacteraceae bacterium]
MTDRTYTAEEVDAAVEALQDPERLKHAEEVVIHAAPGLQRILNEALHSGGWFDDAHEHEVRRVAESGDVQALRTLLAEETRLGMMVGVAVGFELAHELQRRRET